MLVASLQQWSYKDLYRDTCAVAASLLSLGVKNGEAVSIIGPNCPQWILSHAGAASCGALANGIYTTNRYIFSIGRNLNTHIIFLHRRFQIHS